MFCLFGVGCLIFEISYCDLVYDLIYNEVFVNLCELFGVDDDYEVFLM